MDDQQLDQRLRALDPAGPPSVLLDHTVATFARVPRRRRRLWSVALTIGAAVALTSGLAATTDLDEYLLSIPPFMTLDDGAVRTLHGLPYSPLGSHDHGESCLVYVDFTALTSDQLAAANERWDAVDPEVFAAGVAERIGDRPPDAAEVDAKLEQVLAVLAPVIPDIQWGFTAGGGPSVQAITTTCAVESE